MKKIKSFMALFLIMTGIVFTGFLSSCAEDELNALETIEIKSTGEEEKPPKNGDD